MAKMVNPLQVVNKSITRWLFAFAILFFIFGRGSGLLTLFDTNFALGELSSMTKLSYERNDLGHLERTHPDSYLQQLDRLRTNRTAVMAIGNLAFLQGKREEATIIWQEFGIPSADALKLSGDYANSQNYYDEALNLYTQAVNHNPNLSEVWYAIGVLQQEQDQLEAAIEAYETSWSLRNSKSIEPLGMLYNETGKYELAIEVWEEALRIFPDIQGGMPGGEIFSSDYVPLSNGKPCLEQHKRQLPSFLVSRNCILSLALLFRTVLGL